MRPVTKQARAALAARDQVQVAAFHAGTDFAAWQWLGAWPQHREGLDGYAFAVWAPNATAVGVIGEFNQWRPDHMVREGQIWRCFIAGAQAGELYKFRVADVHGLHADRADPMARHCELRPGTASRLVGPTRHVWGDQQWMAERGQRQRRDSPLSIYEVHLGSWRKWGDDPPNYRELAPKLADWVARHGFTHVELLPPMEHPYDPSWGYQVTGYFAPTSRCGTHDDFRFLVDTLHRAGIGVLVDWVPAHFPRDAHALARFDGTPLYEHPHPHRGEHPDWGTYIFDYGRPEVQSFLLASAHFWLQELHVDGLRVDAVASMLYLDYSRPHGQWTPNEHGGNWNLQAIAFLRSLNTMLARELPDVLCIAEESTSFPNVTGPLQDGGLGFSYKWNMGWMHDTLGYFSLDPLWRAHSHDRITFSTTYAFAEHYVLPLSHDEVVHGKGALIRKMCGQVEHGFGQLRLLYGCQWMHPGKKLLFMGQEFGQNTEWNQDRELDWGLLLAPPNQQLAKWVAALNQLYRQRKALHAGDCDPQGFAWVEGSNSVESILVWQRNGGADSLVVVLHFTPVDRRDHWVPLPAVGSWRTVLSSGLAEYGGDRLALPAPAVATERDGRPWAQLDVSPYCVLVLEHVATPKAHKK